MDKQALEQLATEGGFIPREFEFGTDLDGAYAADFLRKAGFSVAWNRDVGRNGLAVTECGIRLSTNGYISRVTR